jgi:hypothetical protein
MCTNVGQPNIFKWITYDLFLVNISLGVLNPSALCDNLFWTHTIVLVASAISALEDLDHES